MDKEFIIENAIKIGDITTQNGSFAKYTIQAEGISGEMLQKPETPAPKAGDKIFGHFEDSQWGKKFKKAKQGGGFGKSPEQQASIVRQHSQDMALKYIELKIKLGKIKEDFSFRDLTTIIDWFEADALGKRPTAKTEEPPMPAEEIDIEEIEL